MLCTKYKVQDCDPPQSVAMATCVPRPGSQASPADICSLCVYSCVSSLGTDHCMSGQCRCCLDIEYCLYKVHGILPVIYVDEKRGKLHENVIMRGLKKRRQTQFKPRLKLITTDSKKNILSCSSPGCVDSSSDTAEVSSPEAISAAVQSGKSSQDVSGTTMFTVKSTRKTSHNYMEFESATDSHESDRGNRVININKMLEMFNSAISIHSSQKQECEVPQFDIKDEKKWGLGWQYSLKCVKCGFISPIYKLYTEAEKTGARGPSSAAASYTLQSALMDTPIGNRRAQILMAAGMDIPPPSRRGMQKISNIVGQKTTELSTEHMKQKVAEVKSISNPGSATDEISVAVDARYNSLTIGSTKKPGQAASQAIAVACETQTPQQYIVSAVLQNKLCWVGAWLKNRGMEVSCPGGHEGCTANISKPAPLSEFEMGKTIGSDLALQGALVKFATTDGDGKSALGIEQSIKTLEPLWKVERLADPQHLSRSQFRTCNSSTFSYGMFPGKTQLQKKQSQKVFSQDVKARCSLVLHELFKQCCGDLLLLKTRLPKVLQTTVMCYNGDCSKCRQHSMVCSGGLTNSWWLRSMYLGPNNITELNMNDQDRKLLTEILKMRLSEETVMKTRFGTSTQKCESFNRSLSVSLPKNVSYGRNAIGRLSSTILRSNMGIEKSSVAKAELFGVTFSKDTRKVMKQLHKESIHHKSYQSRPDVKRRAVLSRGRSIYEHSKYQGKQSSGYQRGQLDPKPSHTFIISGEGSAESDHSGYTKSHN